MRPMVGMILKNVTAIAVAGAVMVFWAGLATGAQAETVKPLAATDCDRVRQGLEAGLPFGPGFRRMDVE